MPILHSRPNWNCNNIQIFFFYCDVAWNILFDPISTSKKSSSPKACMTSACLEIRIRWRRLADVFGSVSASSGLGASWHVDDARQKWRAEEKDGVLLCFIDNLEARLDEPVWRLTVTTLAKAQLESCPIAPQDINNPKFPMEWSGRWNREGANRLSIVLQVCFAP